MKCAYCHGECRGEFCGPECKASTEKVEAQVEKYQTIFILLLFGSMLFIIPGIIFAEYIWAFFGLMFATMGATMIVFPFVTPETCKMMGIRNGMRLGRTLGAAMLIAGAVLILIDLI